MQICVRDRDHLEFHPQKKKRSSLFCKKKNWEKYIGESSDQLSESQSDS